MNQNKCVVVFSGGQDSTTCLLKMIKERGVENVHALMFYYHQKHEIELKKAKQIAEQLGVKYDLLEMPILNKIAENALTRPDKIEVALGKDGALPTTFVDGRNMLFLTFASIWAKAHGIHDIVTGVCETDFSGYPDCRDVFVKALNVTLNLAMDYQFRIFTPLMWLNKCETWQMADELGYLDFVFKNTHTCYNGIEGGCGTCPACNLRNKGYEEYMKKKNK